MTKKQIELATERKMFAELKKKFGREFVTKENLEVTYIAVSVSFRVELV